MLQIVPQHIQPDNDANLGDKKKSYTKSLEDHKSRISVLLVCRAFYVTNVDDIPYFPNTDTPIFSGCINGQKAVNLGWRHDNIEAQYDLAVTLAGWQTTEWLASRLLASCGFRARAMQKQVLSDRGMSCIGFGMKQLIASVTLNMRFETSKKLVRRSLGTEFWKGTLWTELLEGTL